MSIMSHTGGSMTLNRWFVVLVSTVGLIGCADSTAPVQPDQLTARWAGREWTGNAAVWVSQSSGADTLMFYANGPIASTPLTPWWDGRGASATNAISVKIPF